MDAHRKQPWLRRIIWLVIPLAFLLAAQIYTVVSTTFQWYEGAEQTAGDHRLDVLFVGSSRVKAAIDPNTFEKVVQRQQGDLRAVNLGVGGSTLRQHLLGVRNLCEIAPSHTRGITVFVETYAGIPGSMKGWFMSENPRLLAEVMRAKDLPAFWGTRYSLEQKLSLTVRLAMFKFRPFFWKERIRRTIIDKGAHLLGIVTSALGVAAEQSPKPAVDLAAGGGIRTDEKGVALVRKQALAIAHHENGNADMDEGSSVSSGEEALVDWETNEVGELVRLAQGNGGQVVFFEAPLHSIYRVYYGKAVHPATRRSFDAARKRWGTPLLIADVHFQDSDYPDISHLSKSMAPRFTQALAEQWMGRAPHGSRKY